MKELDKKQKQAGERLKEGGLFRLNTRQERKGTPPALIAIVGLK